MCLRQIVHGLHFPRMIRFEIEADPAQSGRSCIGVWCGLRRYTIDVVSSVFQAAVTDGAYQRVKSAQFLGNSCLIKQAP